MTPLRSLVLVGLLLSRYSLSVAAEPLPGTAPLEIQGDAAEQMVAGIDRFLLGEIDKSVERRARHWKRDTSSAANYTASLQPNRQRLVKIIGAADDRPTGQTLENVSSIIQSELVGKSDGPGYHFEAITVRWRAVRDVTGEGLLLMPAAHTIRAIVVALPDADQTPEMLAGLAPGIEPRSQFARRLAENGCLVLVPALVDRGTTLSVDNSGRRRTNQPHREFIYRPAFELGRHIIGYEVQKVLAGIDCLKQDNLAQLPVGVAGYGEGGLLALYAAALDPRIDVALVSGYFDARESLWQEPIYRNVQGLLDQFGDAELAAMIAPRALVIEACRGPQIDGPPPAKDGQAASAAPGRLATPALNGVQRRSSAPAN